MDLIDLYTADDISNAVDKLGAELRRDFEGTNPLFVGVLTGSFVFVADLIRATAIPSQIDFIRARSYGNSMESSGAVEITRARDNGRGNTRGWTATAELGEGGYEFFLGRRHAGTLWNGASLGAAYISTDDDARGVAGDQAFLGPEFRITLLGVGLAMGHYWRVEGSEPGEARLFDISFLIGIW